jgi:hypothetical protein
MKKLAVLAVAVVAVVGFAATVLAFDLPSKVPTNTNELKDAGGTMAVQTALNKEIENAKCTSFKGNTAEVNCNLKTLANKLAAASKASKEAAKYNVSVRIVAGPGEAKGKKATKMDANERALKIRDELKSGMAGLGTTNWNYNTEPVTDTNKLAISVKVEK